MLASRAITDLDDIILVTGVGGVVGGHVVAHLLREGYRRIRAVDPKPLRDWQQPFSSVDNRTLDLRSRAACEAVCRGARFVYHLAADMGGMGYIERHKTECMLSVLIDAHLFDAAAQAQTEASPLREVDAYPAMPEDGYGWQKLFSERLCRHFLEERRLATRVARYRNAYGPYGSYHGGREKAPAAICRKDAMAKVTGHHEIEIWGDGNQTRSFMFVDDCIEGTLRLMASDFLEPLNVGSAEVVSINRLVDIVSYIAGIRLERRHNLEAPQGVRGRSSDNALVREVLGWKPTTSLTDGMERTYAWIYDRIASGDQLRTLRSCLG